jgi:hypothetical protein
MSEQSPCKTVEVCGTGTNFTANIIDEPAAEGGRKPKPTKPSKTYPIKTKKTVMINGKSRTIYEGKRGGEYIRKGDGFVKVAEAIKSKAKSK